MFFAQLCTIVLNLSVKKKKVNKTVNVFSFLLNNTKSLIIISVILLFAFYDLVDAVNSDSGKSNFWTPGCGWKDPMN